MTKERSVDVLLHYMPSLARDGSTPWVRNFAASVARASQRRGWQPSPKQHAVMRRLVSEIFAASDRGADVIEDDR